MYGSDCDDGHVCGKGQEGTGISPPLRPWLLKAGWSTSTGAEGVQSLENRKKKVVGEPDEGKPHVRFEVAGDGDQTW